MFATVGALHVACDWIHGEGEGEGEGEGAGVDVHNMRLNTAHCALVLYGVHIALQQSPLPMRMACHPQR